VTCPSCGRSLTGQTAGGLTVDVCSGGCGGIWFDQAELRKVDEPSESAGEALLGVPRDPSVVIDLEARRICPKCSDRPVLMRHFTSVKRLVTIDECPECAGVWLDAGELRSIRAEFPSAEARQQAAEAYFAELVDGPLAIERAKTEAELARAPRFAGAFRYLCPSWYVPGKQDWGAF
jgi:Zn-finger nucleic acid-binding protein